MPDIPRQGSPQSTVPIIAQSAVPDNMPGHSQIFADGTGALQVKSPSGTVTAIGGGGGGSGTVTSVTFTGDGTVLSNTPSPAVTSSGTLTASLANATGNTALASPVGGGSGAPGYRKLINVDLTGTNGTSGQVLTNQGAGAAPTWVTPAGGGGFTAATVPGPALYNISNKTANYTILQSDAGTLFTDRGSTGSIFFTLPSNPTVGTTYGFMTFFPSSAQRINVTTSGTDKLQYSGSSSTTLTTMNNNSGGRTGGGNFIFITYMGGNIWSPTGGFYFDWIFS